MKYTVLVLIAMGIFWIWRFVSAAVERGFPTHPLYYVSAVIGVIIAFMAYKVTKKNPDKRRYAWISVLVFITAILLNVSDIEILKQIGSGLFFWYLLSSLGFYGYFIIRKWLQKKELSEGEETLENINKGFVLAFLVIAAIFIPMLIIIFVMAALFN